MHVRLVVLLAALVLTAGCLSTVPGDGGTASPEGTSPPPATASPTPDGHEASMNEPDPDKLVRVDNARNHSVTLAVSVHRTATNETVYDERVTVPAGAERVVYDLSRANPDGVEAFTVVVREGDETQRVRLETSLCYGDAYADLQADGSLYLYYELC